MFWVWFSVAVIFIASAAGLYLCYAEEKDQLDSMMKEAERPLRGYKPELVVDHENPDGSSR